MSDTDAAPLFGGPQDAAGSGVGDAASEAEPAAPNRKRGRPRKSDDAPKPSTDSPPSPTAKRGRPPRNNLKGRLQETVGAVGLMVAVVEPFDGMAILNGAENLATALDNLAAENPSVQRTLEQLLQVSAWGQVMTAVAAIAVPIAAHHGILPAQLAGAFAGPIGPQPAPTNGNGVA